MFSSGLEYLRLIQAEILALEQMGMPNDQGTEEMRGRSYRLGVMMGPLFMAQDVYCLIKIR